MGTERSLSSSRCARQLIRLFCRLGLVMGIALMGCGASTSPTTPVGSGGGSTVTYGIGGTVQGLHGTIVLRNNATDDLTLDADGAFAFATTLADGATYDVQIAQQPTGYVCDVTNGTGTVAGAAIDAIRITCDVNRYALGGTISGLVEGEVVLRNNDDDPQTFHANGDFILGAIAYGASYAVSVVSSPVGFTCSVAYGVGTVPDSDVSTVEVVCDRQSYTVGGSITGLVGNLVLSNNGQENITVSANGDFAFATAIAHGSDYMVAVVSQPASKICSVSSGAAGTVNGAPVTSVVVTCDNVYVRGILTGFSETVLLQNNGGEDLAISANGNFTFPTPRATGDTYDISVLSTPMYQRCTVTSGTGTLDSNQMPSPVTVTCTTSRLRIFTTSNPVNGAMGGRVGVDTLCHTAASQLNLVCATGVHALISVDDADEIRDMPSNYGVPVGDDVEIWSLMGSAHKVEDSWAILFGSNHTAFGALGGAIPFPPYWWSGSNLNGTLAPGYTCDHWTSADSGLWGGQGNYNNADFWWIVGTASECNRTFPLTCLCY